MKPSSREQLSSFAAVIGRRRRTRSAPSGRGRFSDVGLAAVGLVAALGSASFAGYMITTDHSNPQFVGAEHLMLFAQPIRSAAIAPTRLARRVPADPGIDFTPVGSIPAPADGSGSQTKAQVAGYVLREAHDGMAVVDGPRGSFEVIPGATLPEAGKVISIEFRGGKWQVVTEAGLISARR